MKSYQTRIERRNARKAEKQALAKKAVTVVGTSVAVVPVLGGVIPGQQAEASEYNYQQPSAAQNLIAQIGPVASQIADANDLYASVMIAQALLESGNGGSGLSQAPYYNLFGVKGTYNGQAVYMPTLEYLNGQWVTMNEPFRQYNSYWESMQDHADVLRGTSFATGVSHYSGTWKSNTTSYLDATAYLTGRYATDPGYAGKLNYLISAYNLTQYDTPSWSQPTTATSQTTTSDVSYEETSYESTETTATETTATSTASTSGEVYTVVSGDTLWDIASAYGITVDQLMENNGLTSDAISVGQQLAV